MELFVTGTGTDVGKTIVSAWICLHTQAGYWKPIQTGTSQGTDTDFLRKLGVSPCYPERYAFKEALSPHTAAKREGGARIELDVVAIPPFSQTNVVVEGAGGVLVPLNEDTLMIDLIQRLGMPVLIVAHTGLGTLNHTLLTLEALRKREIPIKGIVLNGPSNPDNKQSLIDYGNIEVLAELKPLHSLTRDALLSIPLPRAIGCCFS
ncbi:MAG: dethiobiotin synthase [Alphaproteobacteria bacterium]